MAFIVVLLLISMAYGLGYAFPVLRNRIRGTTCISAISSGSSSTPALTDLDAIEEAQPYRGSGVDKQLEKALTMLGKCPVSKLKEVITKHSPNVLQEMTENKASKQDTEAWVQAALAATWSVSGDWTVFLDLLNEELKDVVEEADKHIKESVEYANTMSEAKLKALLIRESPDGINSLPKIRDKTKYKGTFLKGDYVAVLIDCLREKNGNDYAIVAAFLEKEKHEKKGFAS